MYDYSTKDLPAIIDENLTLYPVEKIGSWARGETGYQLLH